jgi:hypothetical protein
MDVQVFFQVAKNSLRPTIPKNMPLAIVEVIKKVRSENSGKILMYKCWAESPDERPTAQELYEHLVTLETEYGKQVASPSVQTEDEVALMLKNRSSTLLKGSKS